MSKLRDQARGRLDLILFQLVTETEAPSPTTAWWPRTTPPTPLCTTAHRNCSSRKVNKAAYFGVKLSLSKYFYDQYGLKSENKPNWETPENINFLKMSFFHFFSEFYGWKVPKWNCTCDLLPKQGILINLMMFWKGESQKKENVWLCIIHSIGFNLFFLQNLYGFSQGTRIHPHMLWQELKRKNEIIIRSSANLCTIYSQMKSLGLPVGALRTTPQNNCSKLPPAGTANPAVSIESLGRW